ncbi:MAG: hypothetical protein LBS80_04550 [Tannerella sp.]|nr:hypothetical protein [Tannerella sp.]
MEDVKLRLFTHNAIRQFYERLLPDDVSIKTDALLLLPDGVSIRRE